MAAQLVTTVPLRGAQDATSDESLLGSRQLPPVLLNSDGTDLDSAAHLGDHPWYDNLDASAAGNQPPTVAINTLQDFLALRLGAFADSALLGLSVCGNWNDPVWEIKKDRIAALGDDPYKTICDWWKQNPQRKFYFSMRMNDNHHQFLNTPGLWMEFRKNNRHLFINPPTEEDWSNHILPWIEQRGPRPENIKEVAARRDWVYDYAKPEVREHYLSVMREALQRYNLDGLELDFLRFPPFFKQGEVDTRVMTGFMREVHGIVSKAAGDSKRRINLIIRVPESPRQALGFGLDVEEWLRQGWIDGLIAGAGKIFSNNPLAAWLEMTRPHQVPVYGAIERTPAFAQRYFVRFATPEGVRAAAAMLRELGADGIYLFNFMSPDEKGIISDIQDPTSLASLPKEYFADCGFFSDLPARLAEGERVELPLVLGDNPGDAQSMRLEVVWDGENEAKAPVVSVNGELQANFERQVTQHWPDTFDAPAEYRGKKPANRFTIASEDIKLIRKALKRGRNTIVVEARGPSTILSVSLRLVPGEQ